MAVLGWTALENKGRNATNSRRETQGLDRRFCYIEFIAAFPARIINIHPSLLPKFPGLDTHKQALDNKATEHGCTVHLVDEGVDTGKIIAHARLEINQNETEESLAKRVLDLEHQIFPWVLNQIGLKNINIVSNLKVTFNDKARLSAKERFFNIEM
jgi:folate-dependent phosphoribosylglycinamide formyltransferase PurN